MKIHDFSQEKSVLNTCIAQLRDVNIQKDRMRFRRNLARVGEILGYELSRCLEYRPCEVVTPLGVKPCALPRDPVVVCSILRAGLPLHEGLLNCFDDAQNAFISAYRRHRPQGHDFDIVVEYMASPSLEDKVLIIADPMLATGSSVMAVYQALEKYGTPRQVHIVSVIGSRTGVDNLAEYFAGRSDVRLWIATVDEHLNPDKYIVPGLGDAGDRIFGTK